MRAADAPRAIVMTGCGSGIGRHLCGALLSQGHRVLATDVNEEALRRSSRDDRWPEGQVLLRRLDVRSAAAWREAIAQAVAAFGAIDVLLNVAGYLRPGFVHETPEDEVDRHLDINAKGVIFGTQAAARQMVAQGRGHIINIGSLAALAPVPGLCLYSASKFAVRGFSLAAAQELRPHGVHVTVVCPDAVRTPMLELQVDYKEAAMTFSGGRVLTVQDIERVILGPVMRRRPMEVVLPGARGLLAKLACVLPALTSTIAPLLSKKGLRKQEELKGK